MSASLRTRSTHVRGQDQLKQRGQTPPPFRCCSVQASHGLDVARHIGEAGLLDSTNSNANLFWKHPTDTLRTPLLLAL